MALYKADLDVNVGNVQFVSNKEFASKVLVKKVFTMLKFKTLKTQFAVRTSKCTLRVP